MTTGIYKLTFDSGSFYIGKSINMEVRWQQHADKLNKGTAAKPLQNEFYLYGMPNASVLIEAHQDHIDLLEECFIARMNPKLNTTRVPDRLEGIYDEVFDSILPYFSMSTVDHIAKILRGNSDKLNLEVEVEELKEALDDAIAKRSKEELDADVNGRIKAGISMLKILNANNSLLLKEVEALRAYKALPWYKKLFS